MKRLSLYWKCQIAVWLFSIIFGTIHYFINPAFSTFNFYPAIFLHATIGIFFLHMMRLYIVKKELLELTVFKKVLYLIPLTIVFSISYTLVSDSINTIFHWESKIFAAMGFVRKTFIMAFSNFFFFGIWNLTYFIYHYFKQSRLQRDNQIRLEHALKIQNLETEKARAEAQQHKAELEAQALQAQIAQLKKLQQMRSQIASDLHDNIGSTLTSISYYSELVKMQLKEEDVSLKSLLDKIGNRSRGTVIAMSDIVWIINPQNDTTVNLVNRMKHYAAEMLSERNIQYTINTNEEVEKIALNMQQRKSLYLIYKEAVHNAVKYAQCNKVEIDFLGTDHEVNLNIHDDGKGFDVQHANDGNGLINMKRRAEEINAHFEISSVKNKGTHIQLTCKIT
jgi:signal transduction histidine kinase